MMRRRHEGGLPMSRGICGSSTTARNAASLRLTFDYSLLRTALRYAFKDNAVAVSPFCLGRAA